jgi:hypothetical protein
MTIKALYPNVRPTLNLDFAKTKALDPRVTFTRASTATFVGADGLIQTAASGAARFDHNPATGESLGLLVEEARTNLYANSNSATGTGAVVTLNGGSSPNGGTNAILLTANQTGGYAQANTSFTVGTVADHTISFWYKNGTGTATSIRVEGVLNGVGRGYFTFNDVNNGANVSAGATHTATYGIQAFPGGWKRFYMGYNATSGTNATGFFQLRIRVYGIQDTQTCFLFGLQAEAGSFPTSYIPTTGSTVTRAADVATLANTGSSIFPVSAFTTVNSPFGTANGGSTVKLVGPTVKRTAVYNGDLTQTQINALAGVNDEFWRWRVLGSSFALPNFSTNGSVTVDWGDGTIETLTTAEHTFSNGGGYHDIGFRLDSGTYFKPYITIMQATKPRW